MRILIFAFSLLLLPAHVLAERMYVTDELALDLRGGPGNEFRILRMLPAGTPVEILERGEGWSRVRATDTEGWLLTRLLSNEQAARQRLGEAEARAARLVKENAALRQELTDIRRKHEALQSDARALGVARDELEQRYQSLVVSAAEPHRLQEDNRQMQLRLQELEVLRERYETENVILRTNVQRDWLLAGAGVLGGGLLLGLILPPLLHRRKRRSEWA